MICTTSGLAGVLLPRKNHPSRLECLAVGPTCCRSACSASRRPLRHAENLARVYQLLSVNRRLLKIARECEFADVEQDLVAEIEKLKKLRRLSASEPGMTEGEWASMAILFEDEALRRSRRRRFWRGARSLAVALACSLAIAGAVCALLIMGAGPAAGVKPQRVSVVLCPHGRVEPDADLVPHGARRA
jgi:hypothetical protein